MNSLLSSSSCASFRPMTSSMAVRFVYVFDMFGIEYHMPAAYVREILVEFQVFDLSPPSRERCPAFPAIAERCIDRRRIRTTACPGCPGAETRNTSQKLWFTVSTCNSGVHHQQSFVNRFDDGAGVVARLLSLVPRAVD